MALIEIRVKDNTKRATMRKIRQLQKQIPNLLPPHKRIAVFLQKWVLDNFESEGSSVGRWPPFANHIMYPPKGGRWVKNKGIDTSAKLLQHKGDLRSSFQPFFSNRDAGIGSDLSYSKRHEEGERSEHLPQRRMLPKESEIVDDVHDIYDEWLKQTLRKKS